MKMTYDENQNHLNELSMLKLVIRMEKEFLLGLAVTGQRAIVLNRKRRQIFIRYKQDVFHCEDGEALEQMAEVVDAHSLELFLDDMGGCFGQPFIVEDVPAYG